MPLMCMREYCRKSAFCRGLCRAHYELLVKDVRAGFVTWYFLERCNQCKPAQSKNGWSKVAK